MLISVIIPCYKSEKTIKAVVYEIIDTIKSRDSYNYEIILVNDGSPDLLNGKIIDLCKENNNIRAIELVKNFGQANAKMAAFKYSKGDYILCIDDDGQIAVDELYKLIDKLEEGYDVVYAKYEEKYHSLFRNIGSEVNKYMAKIIIGKPKDLYVSSFVAMRKIIIEEILRYNNPYPYPFGTIMATTDKIINVNTGHRKRVQGKSNYNLKRLVKLWLSGATNFSTKPLRLSILLGMIFAIIGFGYGGYVVLQKIFNETIQAGWSSIIAILLLTSGIILCMLGIIGEYIGRIYICINNLPQYVERQTINLNSKQEYNQDFSQNLKDEM